MQPRQAASECVTWERQLGYLCYYLCYLHERLGAGAGSWRRRARWTGRSGSWRRRTSTTGSVFAPDLCLGSLCHAGYMLGDILPSATAQVRPIYWV